MNRKLLLTLIAFLLMFATPIYAFTPSVDVTKDPAIQYIPPGGTAFFTITVTNDGSGPLTSIDVTDPLVPDCDGSIPNLSTGESTQWTCETGPVTADFTNTVTVNAESVAGPASDSDTADVVVVTPLVITKAPPSQTVSEGEAATFTITVENRSSQALTGVSVSDPLSPDCDRDLPDMPARASTTYTCQSDPVSDGFVNTATVDATYLTLPFSDSDTAVVDLPGGGGGGGCNTAGPAPGEPIWPEMGWLVLLGGILIVMRRRGLNI